MTYSISPGNLYRRIYDSSCFAYIVSVDSNIVRILEIRNNVYLSSVLSTFDFGFRYKQLS